MEELNVLNKRTEKEQGNNDLEGSGLLPNPETSPVTNSKMDAKSLRWCGGGALLLAILAIIGTIVAFTVPAGKTGPVPPVPWMSIPQKSIFKVALVLTSSSDTSSGTGGWIQAFSNGRSCETRRFVFRAGAATEIFMDNPAGCRDFKMDANDTMQIKVKKESGASIVVYQVKVMLEDGREYSAYVRPQQNETLAESFPLKIERKGRKLAMYLNYKQVKPNTQKIEYINQTKVELKLVGDSHISCQTNPLPWPAKNGTTVLQDLEFLGTCHTFDLLNIRNNLEARFTGPKEGEFIVTKILLKSTEPQVQTAEWFMMPVMTGIREKTWISLFYDGG